MQQLFQTFVVGRGALVIYSSRRTYRSGKALATVYLVSFERIDAVNYSHSFGLLRKASVEIPVEMGVICKAYEFRAHHLHAVKAIL